MNSHDDARADREDRRRVALARFVGLTQSCVASGLHRPDAPRMTPTEALRRIEAALAELDETTRAINSEIGRTDGGERA